MKRYPLYILLASTLVLTSCDQALDQTPSSSRNSEESVTSLDDLASAVRGVYAQLNTRYGYSGETALYADGHGGDIKIVAHSYNHSTSIHRFITEKTSSFSDGAYAAFSIVSGRVNDILQYVDQVEKAVPDGEKAEVANQVSQLYALRGLAHLELARIFSYLPTTGVNLDAAYSGIPLNNEVRPIGSSYQRSTLRETYAQIVSDLTKSLEGLSKEKTLKSGAINYWAAEALLARTYLYLGDWQNAYKYASDVIESSPYKLYTVENYAKVWGQQGTSESLFEVLTTEKNNA
ncbi:RagB/SusD family nutrient uptake outer membrane protein, partial [Porphyromonas sp.]